MPTLATKEYCTGCTACACVCPNGCITMVADSDGFPYPSVDLQQCLDCGLCQQACPVLTHLPLPEQDPTAWAAFSQDEAIRLESSSGGVFTELARSVLKQGGAVFGAAYNAQFEVEHICVNSEDALAKLRGSKYAQSHLGHTFQDVKLRLDQGQRVLFSGTPCQVGGLIAFLSRPYENLLTVDLVCHSVPSPKVWKTYVRYRAQQDNCGQMPESVNLRSKETGWSRYQYANRFQYAGNHVHIAKSGDSLYMKLFSRGLISRPSCAHCAFKGDRRSSDLTLGDFWGVWDIAPEMDDNKGTSLVLVHTPKGAQLLDQLSKHLSLLPIPLEKAGLQNPAIYRSFHPHEKRDEVLSHIFSGNIGECEKWVSTPKPSFPQRIRRKLSAMLRFLK